MFGTSQEHLRQFFLAILRVVVLRSTLDLPRTDIYDFLKRRQKARRNTV